jgi:hypothetical protein
VFDAGNALPTLSRSRNDGGWGFGTPSSHLQEFMKDDPRMKHTIILQGDSVDAEHNSYDTKLTENESGRQNRKYYLGMADRPDEDAHKKSPLNHILMRYADLLLIHAEAAQLSGDDGGALGSLNEVRRRAGVSELDLSGNDLLEAIYAERRMELAMEGHRYFDLKRTGRLTAAMADFVDYNMNRSSDPYDAGNDKGILFEPGKHYIFPIPLTEINLSGGIIDQNPNY